MVRKSILIFLIISGMALAIDDDQLEDYQNTLADGGTVTLDDGTTVSGSAQINSDGSIDCSGSCNINNVDYAYIKGMSANGDGTFNADEFQSDAGTFVGAQGCTETGCQEVQLFQNGNSTAHSAENLQTDGDTFTVDYAATLNYGDFNGMGITGGSFAPNEIHIDEASLIDYGETHIMGAEGYSFDGVETIDKADSIKVGDTLVTDAVDVYIFPGEDGEIMHGEFTSSFDGNIGLLDEDTEFGFDADEELTIIVPGFYQDLYDIASAGGVSTEEEIEESLLEDLPNNEKTLNMILDDLDPESPMYDIVIRKLVEVDPSFMNLDDMTEEDTSINVNDLEVYNDIAPILDADMNIQSNDPIDLTLPSETINLGSGEDAPSSVYIADGLLQGATWNPGTRYENHDMQDYAPPMALYVPDGGSMAVEIIREEGQESHLFPECTHCGSIDYIDHSITLKGQFEYERLQDELPIFTDIIQSGSDNNIFTMQMDDDMDIATNVDFTGDEARIYTMDFEVKKDDDETYYQFRQSDTPFIISQLGDISFFPDNSLVRTLPENTFSMYSEPASDGFLADYDSWVTQAEQNTRT